MKEIVESIAAAMEAGWNKGSGIEYAAPFATDADFVTVYGHYASGRDEIAAGHDAIFRGVYKDSTARFEVLKVRALAEGVLVAHLRAQLSVPDGVMKGDHEARPSLVVVRKGDRWEVAALQNTWAARPPWL